MKEEKYKGYKSFTPVRCKACGSYIDEDIHDSLCLACLDAVFEDVCFEEDAFEIFEEYIEEFEGE